MFPTNSQSRYFARALARAALVWRIAMQVGVAVAPRFEGLVVFGTPQQAERNVVRALEYPTQNAKAKLMLCSLATHQYFRKRLTAAGISEQTCLHQSQLSKTFRSLLRSGLVCLANGQIV